MSSHTLYIPADRMSAVAAAIRAVSQLAQHHKQSRVDIFWASGGQEEEGRNKNGKKYKQWCAEMGQKEAGGVHHGSRWRLHGHMQARTHTHTLRLTPLPPSSNKNHVWPRGGKGGGFTPQTRCATSSGVAPLPDALRAHSHSVSFHPLHPNV